MASAAPARILVVDDNLDRRVHTRSARSLLEDEGDEVGLAGGRARRDALQPSVPRDPKLPRIA